MLSLKLISFDINQAALDLVPSAEDVLADPTVENAEKFGLPMGEAFIRMAIEKKVLTPILQDYIKNKAGDLWQVLWQLDLSYDTRLLEGPFPAGPYTVEVAELEFKKDDNLLTELTFVIKDFFEGGDPLVTFSLSGKIRREGISFNVYARSYEEGWRSSPIKFVRYPFRKTTQRIKWICLSAHKADLDLNIIFGSMLKKWGPYLT